MTCLPRPRRRRAAAAVQRPCPVLPRPRRAPAADVRYTLTAAGHAALEASR